MGCSDGWKERGEMEGRLGALMLTVKKRRGAWRPDPLLWDLLDADEMPPVTVADPGIWSWFWFESCELCCREISVWLISGQRNAFLAHILLVLCLFCSISPLWDLPIYDGSRGLRALTTLGRASLAPCRVLSEGPKTTFVSKTTKSTFDFIKFNLIHL